MYKPFMLHPRYVLAADRDKYFITASQLSNLWKVPAKLCQAEDAFSEVVMMPDFIVAIIKKNILHLFPDPSGKYMLTLEQEIFKQKHL